VERVEREYGQGPTPSQGAYLRQRILSAINISVDDTWIEIEKLWDRTDWQLEKAVMAVAGNKEEG
jgi:hypothetical protein